jgi:DNA polymerase-3 subunit gamma/tau
VETGHTSHAYLFVGTRGTGKTTCAKILSRALNCEHPVNGDPCNECASCRGIESGGVLDVVEIDAASNNGVDNIRAIRDEAVYSPASVKKRVYIIDEVHMLSNSAFNALLKILEEPPEHLVFILATTELNKVPATILSRCQRFSFKRIMPEDIVKRIKYIASCENIDITDGAAALLARLGDGSMRDALSLFDQCLSGSQVTEEYVLQTVGLSGSGDTQALWEKLVGYDLPSALSIFQRLYLGGSDPTSVLNELLSLIRDMMIVKIAPKGASSLISGAFSAEMLGNMSSSVSTQCLISASAELQDTLSKMGTVRDKRTLAEVCLIKLSELLSGNAPVAVSPQPAVRTPAPASAPAVSTPPSQPSPGYSTHPEPTPPEVHSGKPSSAPKYSYHNNPWDEVPPPVDEYPPQSGAPVPPTSAPSALASEPVSPSGGNEWDKILVVLKDKVDFPVYLSLSDTSSLSVSVSGGNLKITTNNDFISGLIGSVQMKTTIAQAASEALGHPVVVSVAFGELPKEFNEDKLDELSRFNNIKFQ